MKKVAWLLPSLLEGSGGHRTILHHAKMLEDHGYECHIFFENTSALNTRAAIQSLLGFDFKHIYNSWEPAKTIPAVAAIATIWYSAKFVRDLKNVRHRCYFIQDYEAYFNPMGSGYLMAENSYTYGLTSISIGRWLAYKLTTEYHSPIAFFDFCADTTTYKPLPGLSKKRQVCMIYQPEKPRRCSELGIEALGIVKANRPDVEITLYGSKTKGQVWFDHRNLGLLSTIDCNTLYNESTVGLCLSSSNPSRIPFEMMAASLPVVELYRSCTLYDLPNTAVSLCEQTPESLAQGIIDILDNPQKRESMAQAGYNFMKDRNSRHCEQQFLQFFDRVISGEEMPSLPLPDAFPHIPIRANRHLNTASRPPRKKSLLKKIKSFISS